MNKRSFVPFLIGFVIILALIGLNLWLFPILFNTSYLEWYLKNATLIGFVTGIIALAWGGLDRQAGLISSHPLDYLGACTQLVGIPVLVIGTHMRTNKAEGAKSSIFDILLMIPILLVFVLMMMAWLAVVVPVQYFMYLVCGAPARVFSKSDRRVIANLNRGQVKYKEVGPDEKVPADWWDASLSSKPYAITNIIAGMLAFGLRLLLG